MILTSQLPSLPAVTGHRYCDLGDSVLRLDGCEDEAADEDLAGRCDWDRLALSLSSLLRCS